ncbi:Uncharacterised protein [Citrobacter koseri]|uniref:Uncharacterized protein n=1 Tax=Citrobacter koseri TaxID=545 RepID=A0A2X2WEE1_CITKO|nr:Uncharacterised protein [Citrobacter koseri]
MSAKKGLDLSGLDNFSALMGGDPAPYSISGFNRRT